MDDIKQLAELIYEAKAFEHITDFVNRILSYSRERKCNITGKFNDIYIEVNPQMTQSDVKYLYNQQLKK